MPDKSNPLRSLPFFEDCSESSLQEIIRSASTKKLRKDSFLFFQGDQADEVYIIQSGTISILLDSPDGRELTINELRAGDFFGELALLTGRTRSTTALVTADCELLVIQRPVFMAIVKSEPQLARRILNTTVKRLHISSDRESALAFMDAESRVARVLLRLNQQEIEKGFLTISQDEIAQHAGITRQTVAKALGRWRRAGWLLTGRGRIVLLNESALKNLIQE